MKNVDQTSIFLIGMMGSGKSTVGKLLAEELEMEFIDLDQLIEVGEGRSIAEIFSLQGETEFRIIETRYLMQTGNRDGKVIACGGGVVLKQDNCDYISRRGIAVFLDCALNELARRLAYSSNRPLLSGSDLRTNLKNIWEKRRSSYESLAKITVNSGIDPPKGVVDNIIAGIERDYGNN